MATELSVEPGGRAEEPIRIANPLSVEQSVLRPSLLGSLLVALRSNLRQNGRVLLYELARTWHGELNPLPDERRHVGLAVVGPRNPRGWSAGSEALDFYDLKGIIDALVAAFHVDVSYAPARHASLHPGRTAEARIGEQRFGVLGQLHPTIAARFDVDTTGAQVFVAELDFEVLLQAQQTVLTIRTPSRFPQSDRDVSFYIDEGTPHGAVEAAIREAGGPLLESVHLFDVYTGQSNPAGRKSLAFALRYRAADRTLEDDEVSAVHGQVESMLRERFGADVRGR
jgi:phenylalanyl-tRNA synthetase beta chain